MIGWIDGGAGASGDMLLGALVDLGVPIDAIREAVDPLDLGVTFREETVSRAGIGALRLHVEVPTARTVRHLPEILAMFERLADPGVRADAAAVFGRLADAEAAVHRTSRDEVHFHEVGALDAIADIVGVCAGFGHLRRERGVGAIHCSTLSLGSGTARSSHGPIPVPVPAVVQLLTGVAPVAAGPAPFESTTPTGAALLAHLVDVWGPMPPMTITSLGAGAGRRDAAEVCNALRLVVGEPVAPN